MQRYFNKWVSTAFDLFGTDQSSSAQWAYVWGLKGRFDERTNAQPADERKLNEHARELYRQEVSGLIERLNQHIPADEAEAQDSRARSSTGASASGRDRRSRSTASRSSARSTRTTSRRSLPTAEDRAFLADVFKERDWILEKKVDDKEREWLAGPSGGGAVS